MASYKEEVLAMMKLGIKRNEAVKIKKAGYNFDDLPSLSLDDIINIKGIGKKNALSTIKVIESYFDESLINDTFLEYNDIIASNELLQLFYNYIEKNDCSLYALKPLSIYTINAFIDNGYDTFKRIARFDKHEISLFDSKAVKMSNELEKAKKYYYDNNKQEIIKYINQNNKELISKNIKPKTERELKVWIKKNKYEENFEKYLIYTDLNINELDLSNILMNSLGQNNVKTRSQMILNYFEINPSSYIKMGKKRLEEYERYCIDYIDNNIEDIVNYCQSNQDDVRLAYYQNKIEHYISNENRKLQLSEIADYFKELSEHELDECLEELKKRKKISITKKGISFLYPSFIELVNSINDERKKEIMLGRISGLSLEEIGKRYNITRERVRQIEKRVINSIMQTNVQNNEKVHFFEDRYVYIYEKYNLDKESFKECFDLSEQQMNTIQLLSTKRGTDNFDELVTEDELIDENLKIIIQKYFDKNILKIRGRRIPLKKNNIRLYVLSKYCRKDTTIEEYFKYYNDFLNAHKLNDIKELSIDYDILRSLENQFSMRTDVLWKQWGRFRYYDINANDYTELLEELSLKHYRNIQISTEKLIKEHKKVIRKYGIFDEYELHNLLKKIINTPELYNQYKEYFSEETDKKITFKKMPGILFGSFDRDEKIKELLNELAPIRVKDFVSFLSKEFGYSEDVINSNWLGSVSKYIKREGVYAVFDIQLKEMKKENMEILKSAIKEPYYSFDDLKKLYISVCPGSDIDEINSMNLKLMGYTVNSNYIVTSDYTNMKEYMDSQVAKNSSVNDIDISSNSILSNYLYVKQYDYDIIMYNKTDYITIQKLENAGIRKSDLYNFSDKVQSIVGNNEFFNYQLLREKYHFSSKLDDLGFDDYFYNKILEFSGKFSYTSAFGTFIFNKDIENITKASFVNAIAKKLAPIEINNLIAYLMDTYGSKNITKDKIIYLLDEEDVYYNNVFEMIFPDYESFSEYIEKY